MEICRFEPCRSLQANGCRYGHGCEACPSRSIIHCLSIGRVRGGRHICTPASQRYIFYCEDSSTCVPESASHSTHTVTRRNPGRSNILHVFCRCHHRITSHFRPSTCGSCSRSPRYRTEINLSCEIRGNQRSINHSLQRKHYYQPTHGWSGKTHKENTRLVKVNSRPRIPIPLLH